MPASKASARTRRWRGRCGWRTCRHTSRRPTWRRLGARRGGEESTEGRRGGMARGKLCEPPCHARRTWPQLRSVTLAGTGADGLPAGLRGQASAGCRGLGAQGCSNLACVRGPALCILLLDRAHPPALTLVLPLAPPPPAPSRVPPRADAEGHAATCPRGLARAGGVCGGARLQDDRTHTRTQATPAAPRVAAQHAPAMACTRPVRPSAHEAGLSLPWALQRQLGPGWRPWPWPCPCAGARGT